MDGERAYGIVIGTGGLMVTGQGLECARRHEDPSSQDGRHRLLATFLLLRRAPVRPGELAAQATISVRRAPPRLGLRWARPQRRNRRVRRGRAPWRAGPGTRPRLPATQEIHTARSPTQRTKPPAERTIAGDQEPPGSRQNPPQRESGESGDGTEGPTVENQLPKTKKTNGGGGRLRRAGRRRPCQRSVAPRRLRMLGSEGPREEVELSTIDAKSAAVPTPGTCSFGGQRPLGRHIVHLGNNGSSRAVSSGNDAGPREWACDRRERAGPAAWETTKTRHLRGVGGNESGLVDGFRLPGRLHFLLRRSPLHSQAAPLRGRPERVEAG